MLATQTNPWHHEEEKQNTDTQHGSKNIIRVKHLFSSITPAYCWSFLFTSWNVIFTPKVDPLSDVDTIANVKSWFCIIPIKNTVKPVLSSHSKRRPKIGLKERLLLNAGQKYCRMLQGEHSAILSTFTKLQFVIKIYVLSIFEMAT